jgi:glycosyltransferase involved in cell wall biosynthesis
MRFDEFQRWIASGRVVRHLARHRDGRVLVARLETAGRPLPLALAMRALCRGRIYLEDTTGRRRPISLAQLGAWAGQLAREPFHVAALLRRVEQRVAALERLADDRQHGRLDLRNPPLHLRTDLSFGVRAGGSVGHIAGVLNSLGEVVAPPIFVTTDAVPTVRPDIETHLVAVSEAFWNFRELPTFVLNDVFTSSVVRALAGRQPAFVYQRYSVNSYAGIEIARSCRSPLVIEYNGSEIWMSRHWGRPLKYEPLSERIELLDLRSADLVVVVSQAMRDELTARGIPADRILVNANGVDTERYRPDVDGRPVRQRFGLDDSIVVGFIGTFWPWHGVDVLARAFTRLLERCPTIRVDLLMIGDGAGAGAVRRILHEGGAARHAVLTGLVPQDEGPWHLAACDILVSPHVPNVDGTPFFGSPTKLFEYMAMGRGIVASDLDQIGEVLEHGRDAWLVPPGDVEALADGIERLVCDAELRARLGANARVKALANHTWIRHTERIVDRLQALLRADWRGVADAGT